MKITIIVGQPASGKSFLMRAFMKRMGNWFYESPPYIPHHVHLKNGKIIIAVGRYDDDLHKFPGTDRMSMACQPHVVEWLTRCKNHGIDAVFIEGDRLGNDSFIKACQALVGNDLRVDVIDADEAVFARRRKNRQQSEIFLKRCRTKISNVMHQVLLRGIDRRYWWNNSAEDAERILADWMRDRT